MNMTHYMELLAVNQPWNLILFMAIPVGLAETVVITELYILFTRHTEGWVRSLNRWAGIIVGLYFLGIIGYLLTTAVIPITAAGQWRTVLDVIAVGAYLLGGIPLVLVALQELGLIQRRHTPEQKLRWHATYVAAFLILGHVAMIVGMTDPGLLGYSASAPHGMEHGAPAGGHGH
jgi:hypothetical protein